MGTESAVVTCPSCSKRNRVRVSGRGRPRCGTCQADLPWLVEADDASFAGAVETSMLVLVDLWAPWCGPCRMVAPILERLSAAYAGQLKVVKVNVDGSPRTSARFNARSIPMLLLIRNGELVDTVVGAQPESTLRTHIDRQLSAV